MANIHYGTVPEHSGKLVVFKESGMPVQYELKAGIRIAKGKEDLLDDNTLYLKVPFLAEDQGILSFDGNHWTYASQDFEAETRIGSQILTTSAPADLKDGEAVHIKRRHHELLLLFREAYDARIQWKQLCLDPGDPSGITIYNEQAVKQMQENPSADQDPAQYHRAHIGWSRMDKSWIIEDVHTDRGIYVNGIKIQDHALVKSGDVIRIGDTLFVLRRNALIYNYLDAHASRLAIHIEERAVWNFFHKKILLSDINLNIDPGTMVLLLGGSGAGKTTFVNAVTGYEKAKAKITNGDLDVYENYDQMKYEIGMVPQQDLLRGEDGVDDTLANAAEMRLPAEMRREEKDKRVQEVLQMFGLESQAHERVDKLSGGQRKRLSIAVEYIADPSLFILDEPDSGLDGVMARDLMERLRKIADENKIVIVITHTPDRVIDLFDKVLVLAKDSKGTGRMAYYGSVDHARKFFGRDTMEEIVKAVNSKEEGGEGRADEFIAKYERLHANDKDEDGEEDQP